MLDLAVAQGIALAEATNFARDLVNEPPNVLTPSELDNRASSMAEQFGLACQILDRPELQELGMGGLLGVAQASVEPPKLLFCIIAALLKVKIRALLWLARASH